ncbi:MAG: amylo-alpha-1,6-glucosidase, partial [Bryobacteraceae bacterium]
VEDVRIEKKLMMIHRQNTVHITYRMLSDHKRWLTLRPSVNFRLQEAPVSTPLAASYVLTVNGETFEISSGDSLPSLRLAIHGKGTSLTIDRAKIQEVIYRIEESRGYAARGDLWSPGYFSIELSAENPVTLVASTEGWDTINALTPDDAAIAEQRRRWRLIARSQTCTHEGLAAELVLAADQFVVVPAGRVDDTLRAHASGDEVRTVIAGYHWFTDWGRDTMISLEGLTLVTGRQIEAGYILRTFAHYIHDGLIPNMFPEGKNQGLYHTADATLWFFHAIDRYLESSDDETLLPELLPQLQAIVAAHIRGTDFGIGVDANDGLLKQGQEGYQLTWMDAKVEDWVVTPRRGKAVEINALWYNALRLLEGWLRQSNLNEQADEIAARAQRVREAFNRRFWYEQGGFLYDVVDGEPGDDPSCRPNQIFAISLKHPVLNEDRWKPVIEVVRRELLTPLGLRSLSRDNPNYHAKYDGDLRSRDAAYHEGTVWAWLIGPYIDAWLKEYPDDRNTVRELLQGFTDHLNEGCIGSISEIFDAEPPYTQRGCVAQAWSVAEVLRCWVKANC